MSGNEVGLQRIAETEAVPVCPVHDRRWVTPHAPDGYRRCEFYVPELGVSEDYGCPQED